MRKPEILRKTSQKPSQKPGTISGVVFSLLLVGVTATASAEPGYSIDVPVIAAEPIYEYREESEPRRVCRPVRRSDNYDRHYSRHYKHHYNHDYDHQNDRENSAMPTLIGGLIGGVIGRQFGKGRGRDALTIAGAFAGASLANSARETPRNQHRAKHRDTRRQTRVRETCHTVNQTREVRVVDAWRVTYLYHGRELTRMQAEEPGDTIPVRIRIEPIEGSLVANRRTGFY